MTQSLPPNPDQRYSPYQVQIAIVMSECVLPIEDGAAKRTRAARAAQEEIPDRVCKPCGLRIGCEADSARCASDTDCHYLSLCLARANI